MNPIEHVWDQVEVWIRDMKDPLPYNEDCGVLSSRRGVLYAVSIMQYIYKCVMLDLASGSMIHGPPRQSMTSRYIVANLLATEDNDIWGEEYVRWVSFFVNSLIPHARYW